MDGGNSMLEWVNRIGIILSFLSFWFVAPEILGEQRLAMVERKIEHALRLMLKTSTLVYSLGYFIIIPVFLGILSNLIEYIFGYLSAGGDLLLIQGNNIFFALGIALLFITVYGTIVAFLKLVESVLPYLTDDTQLRQRWLYVGLFLFIVGETFQLIGTFA